MAWVAQANGVTSPIIGATKASHLDDAVAAMGLKLTPGEVAELEAPYVPHAITGFQ
jgi:aryl-alcohol dehydrogenase-like predicted oxidoreductase